MSSGLWRQRILMMAEGIVDMIVPDGYDLRKTCLHHAMAVEAACLEEGFECLIQAGTATWRVVSKEQDDGSNPTNYTYLFEYKQIDAVMFMLGLAPMPEMHIWNAVRRNSDEPWEIVDLTTRYLKSLALDLGLEWSAPQLPDELWCLPESLPAGCMYDVNETATALALQFRNNFIKEQTR